MTVKEGDKQDDAAGLRPKDLLAKGKEIADKRKEKALKKIQQKKLRRLEESNDGLLVRSLRHWDVKVGPAKQHMVLSQMVPVLPGIYQSYRTKERRVQVEIRTPPETSASGDVPSELVSSKEELGEGEKVLIRIFRHVTRKSKAKDSSANVEQDENEDSTEDSEDEYDDDHDNEWKQLRNVTLDGCIILQTKGNVCEIKFGRGSDTTVQDVTFVDTEEALQFQTTIEHLRVLDKERAEHHLLQFQETFRLSKDLPEKETGLKGEMRVLDKAGPISLTDGNKLKVLIEIVSAQNLPCSSYLGVSDAYVVVRLGSQELHRTDPIPDTPNPIWTVKTGSLCLLDTTAEEFFVASTTGVTFLVKDYQVIAGNDIMGRVRVSATDITAGNEERIEHKLILEPEYVTDRFGNKRSSTLVLRYRLATEKDIEFMDYLALVRKKTIIVGKQSRAKKIAEKSEHSFVPPRVMKHKITLRKTRIKDGVKEYRVKPCPDPKRLEETTWMTSEQIRNESLKRSQEWIAAGGGTVGKIFLELIGCDDLKRSEMFTSNHTFATLVYEDICVNSCVIDDTNHPRWPPWSQRAFIFNVSHPSSQINLAIFSHGGKLLPNAPVGRVSIDVTNMTPSTVYTLHYKLAKSAEVTRDPKEELGTVTVRVRIEFGSPRDALLSSLKPEYQHYVNLKRKADFQATYFACHGTPNVNAFSMDTIWSYLEELEDYKEVGYYASEAAKVVFLWRGHFPITFHGRVVIRLPIHSIVALVGGLLLVEDFVERAPSFFLFAIAWFFFSTMEYRRHHPSPWCRCNFYWDMLSMLVLDRSGPGDYISPEENEAAIRVYDAAREERLRKLQNEFDEKNEKEMEKAEENADVLAAQAMVRNADEEVSNIVTKISPGMSVNPLRVLFPYQLMLGELIAKLRVAKSIAIWNESYVAFWITSACLVLGVLLLWVPWAFILHWVSRIVVWTFLGPWMKLFDIFYFRKRENMTRKERRAELREKLKLVSKEARDLAREAQIRKEDTVKAKAMACLMFGEYITAPPRHKQARYFDIPLPSSKAEPYVFERDYRHVIVDTVHGQDLVGQMVPLPVDQTDLTGVDRYAAMQKGKAFRVEASIGSLDD